jgi:hypothetical protein
MTHKTIGRLMMSLAATLLVSLLAGCGTGSTSNLGGVQSAPSIVHEPSNATVPMGLTAQFSVAASGYPLNYQWFKNGVAIASATSANYVTPATAFADAGTVFTATVSNSLGSVTTTPAALTVTARAPASGDMRFQQVDAATTVGGYGELPGNGAAIPGRGSAYFTPAVGTPLYFGPIICTQPQGGIPAGCYWPFVQIVPASTGTSLGYGADFATNFSTDILSSIFPAAGSAINASNSVITALDIEPADGLFAVSYMQSATSSGFQLNQLSVTPANLQAALSSEAGISYNSSQVMLMSYGWASDIATVYEAQAVSATSATVSTVAAGLAQQGYIITALGGSNLNDSYFVVGTRVKGDTMPRPFSTTTTNIYDALTQYGYAIVGVIQNSQGQATYLGER